MIKLKLTVLGCWAPYPRAGGACSGYLLEGGGLKIMLEAGSGTLGRLMERLDYRTLDAVIVTHLHHDHYLDLFQLRHAIEAARRDGRLKKPLDLYLPETPPSEYNLLCSYQQAFKVRSIDSLEEVALSGGFTAKRLELPGLSIRLVPTVHLIPGYAVSFQETGADGSRLVFSGDTAPTGQFAALARGADLLLCEASGLNKDLAQMTKAHCTAGQAGAIARAAAAGRLLLTHFFPEYDLAELSAQAEETYGAPVTAVREGETYEVRGLGQ